MKITKKNVQNSVHLAFKGECTFEDSHAIRRLLDEVKSSEITEVVIDLAELNYVDSASLGMMLLIKSETEKHGIKLTMQRPHGLVKKIFEVSKFYQLFNIEP
jgi:HptB-dependent secretion and biofilm anti anti-sigma factor